MFPQVVDKQSCLRSVTAQPGKILDNDRLDFPSFHNFVDFVNALAVEVHSADIVVKGLADDLVPVCDGVFINDFPLIRQGVQFIVLVPTQAVIQPDLHGSSFPLWCVPIAAHTIAHCFSNS